VLSYGSFQRNILNHLSVVIRLLSNEQDVIQHDFIDQCNPHALVAEMDRPLTNDLALAQLNWLLNRKEAFKALESEYRLETPMSTEFGEQFAKLIYFSVFNRCRSSKSSLHQGRGKYSCRSLISKNDP